MRSPSANEGTALQAGFCTPQLARITPLTREYGERDARRNPARSNPVISVWWKPTRFVNSRIRRLVQVAFHQSAIAASMLPYARLLLEKASGVGLAMDVAQLPRMTESLAR